MDADVRPISWHMDCDILKAEEGHVHGERVRFVSGIASEETPDQTGETVRQSGLILKPLLSAGYINYDHLSNPQRSDMGPEGFIGIPTKAEVIKNSSGVPCLYVEGRLFTDDKLKPLAGACWNHLLTLVKDNALGHGIQRRMGWSIEGITLMKARGWIEKSLVSMLAITHKPAHLGTSVQYATVMKSLAAAALLPEADFLSARAWDFSELVKTADTGINAPLLREDLDGAGRKRRTKGEKAMRAIYGGSGCACGEFDPKTGRCRNGARGLLKHMTTCAGWKPDEAQAFGDMMKSAWGDDDGR